MKPYRTLLAALNFLVICACTPGTFAQDATETKVRDLLSRMTLEEKVGQMTQITVDVVSVGADGRQEPHQLDKTKLETALLTYHIGSIINVGPQAYTLGHWHEVITAIQDVATKKTRLKIPVLYGIDAIHGVTYTHGGTLFPQAINMAATFNTDLVREETLRPIEMTSNPLEFYPVMDLGRQPLWPRLWEGYGEDVFLSAAGGKHTSRGIRGTISLRRAKEGVSEALCRIQFPDEREGQDSGVDLRTHDARVLPPWF
jgi:beta-glucosidase